MKSALVLVDIQKDFCPGGALAVPEGDQVVGPANELIEYFVAHKAPIVLTRDWHPSDHLSFETRGGAWPSHCVAGTPGAEFHPGLRRPSGARIVSKASTAESEAYSGFEGTDLAPFLRKKGVDTVIVAGLATDYCVKNTVLDALAHGFRARVVRDGIRAVNVKPGDEDEAMAEMVSAGAEMVSLRETLAAPSRP